MKYGKLYGRIARRPSVESTKKLFKRIEKEASTQQEMQEDSIISIQNPQVGTTSPLSTHKFIPPKTEHSNLRAAKASPVKHALALNQDLIAAMKDNRTQRVSSNSVTPSMRFQQIKIHDSTNRFLTGRDPPGKTSRTTQAAQTSTDDYLNTM